METKSCRKFYFNTYPGKCGSALTVYVPQKHKVSLIAEPYMAKEI